MLTIFFNVRSIIHTKFLSQSQMINQQDPAAYVSLSTQEEMRLVVGPIVATSAQQCTCSQHPEHSLVKRNLTVLEQPPYLPDLALCVISFSQTHGGSSKRPVSKVCRSSKEQQQQIWGASKKNPSSSVEKLWKRNHIVRCLE